MNRSKLFIISIACIFFASGAQAKHAATYADSVKQFFSDWNDTPRDPEGSFVFDNTSMPEILDKCIFKIYEDNYDKQPRKVYQNEIAGNDTLHTDSILVSSNDFILFLRDMQDSKTMTWGTDIFPRLKIATAKQIKRMYVDTTDAAKPVCWAFSEPLFIKKGAYCMVYYIRYCPEDCGKHGLDIYKNVKGHWQLFGTVFELNL